MHSGKISGAALIVGAIGGMVTMAIHPSGSHLDAGPEVLRAAADTTRLAHAIALVSMPLMLFGQADFARRLGFQRASATAGLVFQAFAVMAVLSAAVMSGMVQGELMDSAARSDAHQHRAVIGSQMHYTFVLNQAYAAVYTAASAAAMAAWSLGLWAAGRMRGLAGLGLAVAVGQAAFMAVGGDDALSVHGFMLIILGQAIWAIGIGVALFRDWRATA